MAFTRRIEGTRDFADVFVFKEVIQHHSLSIKEVNIIAPLYIYPTEGIQLSINKETHRVANLKVEIVNQIANGLGLLFTQEKESSIDTFAPIDVLDYVYAVLHSPSYRQKYREVLKEDFLRVPFPTSTEKFWKLVRIGSIIRQSHMLEGRVFENLITQYPKDGDNIVTKLEFRTNLELTDNLGFVYINDTQYFANVPKLAWDLYIGGYQPAQKWLKDRKGRVLNFDDILHYQKIIIALSETYRITKELDSLMQF